MEEKEKEGKVEGEEKVEGKTKKEGKEEGKGEEKGEGKGSPASSKEYDPPRSDGLKCPVAD